MLGRKKKYTPGGMKMDVTAAVKPAVAAAIAAAAVVGFLLLAWIGGELHYRNCLADAEIRHPAAAAQADGALAAREEAAEDCSRWPWS